jgi:hypothetical protein
LVTEIVGQPVLVREVMQRAVTRGQGHIEPAERYMLTQHARKIGAAEREFESDFSEHLPQVLQGQAFTLEALWW